MALHSSFISLLAWDVAWVFHSEAGGWMRCTPKITNTQFWGSEWRVCTHQVESLAFVHHSHSASSWSPKFVNNICAYANTIRKLCSPSTSSQRERGDQPLVIHTDEPLLIAQNVISDYIIFELLQLSLMSTIHQRWALLNGVWLLHAESS